ncbi:MAG TPA: hypothetical protein VGI03_11715 [Verrucomicrobiae bacterium]|jgi:hypothetical protein
MQLELEQRLWTVRNFFTIYVEHARDLAKSGQKDQARSWWKFLFNSGLLGLLSDDNYGVLSDREKLHLSEMLLELQHDCHPLNVPNFETDLQAIRGHLEAISSHLGVSFETRISHLPLHAAG